MAYKVIAECAAHIPVETPEGQTLVTLYKHALLPVGVPQARIAHLLSVGVIEEVAGSAPTMVEVEPQLAALGGEAETAPAAAAGTPYDDPERVAARAKLSADGSAPHANSGQPVWVEFLVSKGYDYGALKDQEKAALIELAKNAS